MTDKRLEINGPDMDSDLIVAVYEIYKGNMESINEGLVEANKVGTEIARKNYLESRNFLGISIRHGFISYMREKDIWFDVEEAYAVADEIYQQFTVRRHNRLALVSTSATEVKEQQIHG